jgi:hypothetical protein
MICARSQGLGRQIVSTKCSTPLKVPGFRSQNQNTPLVFFSQFLTKRGIFQVHRLTKLHCKHLILAHVPCLLPLSGNAKLVQVKQSGWGGGIRNSLIRKLQS